MEPHLESGIGELLRPGKTMENPADLAAARLEPRFS
jgi:hypothetical protein